MSDPRKTPKSKYTAERNIPGAFEGETVTRRRFMTLTAHGAGAVAASAFVLPALGFAAGSALFERPEVPWETVGVPEDFPDDTYVPKVITETSGRRPDRQDDDLHARAQRPGSAAEPGDAARGHHGRLHRDLHPLHAPRLPGPLRRRLAALHLPVPRRRLRLRPGKVSGGPPVRPLDRFYVRVHDGQVQVGPRYSVNSEFRRFPSYRDPGQALDGIGQYMYPGRFSTPKLD